MHFNSTCQFSPDNAGKPLNNTHVRRCPFHLKNKNVCVFYVTTGNQLSQAAQIKILSVDRCICGAKILLMCSRIFGGVRLSPARRKIVYFIFFFFSDFHFKVTLKSLRIHCGSCGLRL